MDPENIRGSAYAVLILWPSALHYTMIEHS